MGSGGYSTVRPQAEAVSFGWYAPQPGSHTGVADYAETLRIALNDLGLRTSLNIYHLGNNAVHAAIYDEALKKPGAVVLHDAVLHHFLLGRLDREAYTDEFVFNYGEWQRPLAEELWQGRAAAPVDPRYFAYPLVKRAVLSAKVVIAHNRAAARIALEHGARSVHVIPHFAPGAPAADRGRALAFRRRHSIAPASFLFGIFGYLRETKRVIPVIHAFNRLRAVHPAVHPNVELLIAGEAVSAGFARSVAIESCAPGIFRVPFLSESELRDATGAVDCCINLRYPAAGESSGITTRMAAAGVPLILTENEESAELPDVACLRVRPGIAEAADLFDHMSLMACFPRLARDIGTQGQRYIRERHSLSNVAQKFRDVICSLESH